MILCGGDLLGVCSETLYSGFDIARPMIAGLHEYMQKHGYAAIGDFRGYIVKHMKSAADVTLYDGYARIIDPAPSGPCKPACRLCKKICAEFAVSVTENGEMYIDPGACVACGMCYNRCPGKNIEMYNTGVIV